jgi:hypothetical protein
VNKPNPTHPQLLGLVELDRAGNVLYAKLERDQKRRDLNGLNFFSDVAPFNNVEEFRRRLDSFANGHELAQSFNFTCDFDDGSVPVKVLVARISERDNRGQVKSILVHIRQP